MKALKNKGYFYKKLNHREAAILTFTGIVPSLFCFLRTSRSGVWTGMSQNSWHFTQINEGGLL